MHSRDGNGDTLGKPSRVFPNDTTSSYIVELVLDDYFLDICLEAIHDHARNDQEFQNQIGQFRRNEQGHSFLKGFVAIEWHKDRQGYRLIHWAWNPNLK